MKALSLRAAQACENAQYPACECRCGGAAHGRARIADVRQLPLDDPHSPSRDCEKCRGTGKQYSGTEWERSCWKCDGIGRYISKKVRLEELPALEITTRMGGGSTARTPEPAVVGLAQALHQNISPEER